MTRPPQVAPRTRPAQSGDDAVLLRLDQAAWQPGTGFPSVLARPRDSFFGSSDPTQTLVAELEGRVVGYLTLGQPVPLPENAHVRQIEGFAVDPAFHGSGVGSRLLADARDFAKSLGATKLSLRVLSTNTGARRAYEQAGFVVEGVLVGEFVIGGAPVDDVLMALPL